MQTHRFAGDQQRLPAPTFQVKTVAGETVSLNDYRNKSNLVLLFSDGMEEERLSDAIEAFARRRRAYEANDAQVLVVAGSVPAGERDHDFPHVAVDRGGEVQTRYSAMLPQAPEQGEALIFVLDRFATPHVAFVTEDVTDAALQEKIVSWVLGIELECPE